MRPLLFATLAFALGTGAASAQPAGNGTVSGVAPKPVATTPIRPATQTPADTANAMQQAERQAIQSDLAWSGHFNGLVTGEAGERMIAAIKAFQKDRGGKPTGVLNPQERAVLADVARKAQAEVGWRIVTDPGSGARVGIPTKLAPQMTSDAGGARWTSSTGTIQIHLARRKEAAPSMQSLATQERKEPAGRKLDYSAVKPDFFIVAGMQGLKKFYVRGTFKDSEVRILTILYDQATEGTMEKVVVAMSSAFNPFPASAQAAGPPPRKRVDYASGVVVSDSGAIVTDREATEACVTLTVAGHGYAERIAEDKDRGLALLRLYGARGLTPAALAPDARGTAFDLVGIADPQSQGGSAAPTVARVSVASPGATESALTPPPATGLSGAGAFDAQGRLAGVAIVKPVLVAGPAAAPAQAVLVGSAAVAGLLKAGGVAPQQAAAPDARASAVRVICVRK